MAKDLSKPDLVVAVFGAGTMGRGIAQVCAQAGITTLLSDARAGAVQEAIAAIDKALDGQVVEGPHDGGGQAGHSVAPARSSSTFDEAAAAGVVIEAIVENLEAKRELFREMEKRIAPDAVLATNTSSLSVTEIAAGCARPERVAGLHFFNPPPLMRLVEVIGGLRTDPALVTRAGRLRQADRQASGRRHRYAGLRGQSRRPRLWAGSAAHRRRRASPSPREVDVLMKEAAGFRMGPFELLDLVGGDVTHAVMVSIYSQYFGEPIYQPSAQMTVRVAGGLLGRKSKQGFYNYDGPPSASPPTHRGGRAAAAGVGLGRRRGRRQRACRMADGGRHQDPARRRARRAARSVS